MAVVYNIIGFPKTITPNIWVKFMIINRIEVGQPIYFFFEPIGFYKQYITCDICISRVCDNLCHWEI